MDEFELTAPPIITRKRPGAVFGHPVSEETRRKFSAAAKGQRRSPATEIKPGQHLSPATEFKATATQIAYKCEQCGVEFLRPDYSNNQNRFCSWDCFQKSLNAPERKVCPTCSRDFLAGGRGNKLRKTVFCSNTCKNISRYRRGAVGNTVPDVDAAHLAGLIEGEGSIILFMNRDVVSLRVTVANTDFALLRKIQSVIGLGSIIIKHHHNPRHSASGQYAVNADAAELLLKQIRPFMWYKTEQADLALETRARLRDPAIKADRTWHLQYCERMRTLNKRGPQAPTQTSMDLSLDTAAAGA